MTLRQGSLSPQLVRLRVFLQVATATYHPHAVFQRQLRVRTITPVLPSARIRELNFDPCLFLLHYRIGGLEHIRRLALGGRTP